MHTFRQSSLSSAFDSRMIENSEPGGGGGIFGLVWGAMIRCAGASRTPVQGSGRRGGRKRPGPAVDAP